MKNNPREKYDLLTGRLEEISRLGGVMSTLHWDQEVMMPPGAAAARANQMAAMAGVLHEKSTDPALGDLLNAVGLADEMQFNPYEWRNIHEGRRDYDLATRVPKSLVQEMAELGSRGHFIWAEARKSNRFEDFAPVMARFVELKTEWARAVYPDLAPYDANIDLFERGVTMAELSPQFENLKAELIPLVQAIRAKEPPHTGCLQGHFPVAKQEALGRRISQDMGFSFDMGRMDISVHPFCGGSHPTDVRITTRYRTDNFIESLYAVIHETGHGLYEQGRMPEGRDLPVSETLSMGIHESQSLFWERMIAQGRAFLSHYLPLFTETFPGNFAGVNADRLYAAVNACQPGLIRVEADEVHYPLHVILRYEIERGLFDGSIAVGDLPAVWNEKMRDYLGLVPLTDTLGVLQDVHWSGGSFGYFPSYTLGALYACQFYRALAMARPKLEHEIERGEFTGAREWLGENIHRRGRLLSAADLTRQVTGEPLNPAHFIAYLKEKYGRIYHLNH
jgi:carboxypeptidase Taq